jgi:hypothetical protein
LIKSEKTESANEKNKKVPKPKDFFNFIFEEKIEDIL